MHCDDLFRSLVSHMQIVGFLKRRLNRFWGATTTQDDCFNFEQKEVYLHPVNKI